MATITRRDTTASSTDNVSTYVSASFTPVVDDLLVVVAFVSGTVTDAATCTASANGITFTLIDSQQTNANIHRLYRFVANQKVPASPTAMTVTVNVGGDAGTGCIQGTLGLQGMSKVGLAAIRQFAGPDNSHPTGGTTPSVTLAQAALTTNPLIWHSGNLVGTGASMTPPSGWTEIFDLGGVTPTIGSEVSKVESGFTGTTVTAGSTYGAGACGVIEFDASPVDGVRTRNIRSYNPARPHSFTR